MYSFQSKTIISDTITPVSIYLNLRDIYADSLLLESSDYHSAENSSSFICCDPLHTFATTQEAEINEKESLYQRFTKFTLNIKSYFKNEDLSKVNLFGFTSYSSIPYFEKIKFNNTPEEQDKVPLIYYSLYRYVIKLDHFNNLLTVTKLCNNDQEEESLDSFIKKFSKSGYPKTHTTEFKVKNEISSNFNDEEFTKLVIKLKEHIARGDVFQIVPSRKFWVDYEGDEFLVYRALRSINPSPYLFYFDYGDFKIFGSSPEAQVKIEDNTVEIHPIAGTYLRTGKLEADKLLAEKLSKDPKENAEHVMLVDLARNDLSKHCKKVEVKEFKEIQYYSHVIHLVSKVTGELEPQGKEPYQVLVETAPAGTLSGAPKYKAMELINKYENQARTFYGGCIGAINLDGDCIHAIMIRTFLAKNGKLFFQAGAGVVMNSDPKSETKEVLNKVAALTRALELGEKEFI